MKLRELFEDVNYSVLQGDADVEIDRIDFDSRLVKGNSLFTCMIRHGFDGHDYAKAAIENGACALMVEHEVQDIPSNITVIKVEDARKSTAFVANVLYGYPSKSFKLVGITGTSGKTTTTILIESILKGMGNNTGLIGTIENHIKDKVYANKNTTPLATELQELFYEMKNENVEYVAMEVSSHSLDFNSVDYSDFDIGVFTNLTQDHMDYHLTEENYRNAKIRLFKMCKSGIINIDDKSAKYFIDEATCDILTYGIENKADVMAKDIKISLLGSEFTLHIADYTHRLKVKTPGMFSVYNALAAIATCYKLDIPINDIVDGIEKSEGVQGRFQTFTSNKGFIAIVDYAHKPDGLLKVLKTIKQFAKGNIITVFGCGGDRDRTKRPIMAEISAQYSNITVITSDNPRTENPNTILDEIEVGIKDTEKKYVKIVDRKEAIKYAMQIARMEDVVLVAGKGHEDYQIIGKEKIHLSDVEEVKKYI